MKVLLLFTLASHAVACEAPCIQNITRGKVLAGIGGAGGTTHCFRELNRLDCSVLPRQLVGAVDFAVDPTGRHLFVATGGLEDIGECIGKYEKPCESVGIHDNSSRLVYFDLKNPKTEPITLSYCGPWKKVEYDAARKQLIALRHANLKSDGHGTHYGPEVVAFDATAIKPAADAHSSKCYVSTPLGGGRTTCACALGFDPSNLGGKVIGRSGLKTDGILPASTMALVGDEVLVGDQNQHCVVAFPLDGSAGAKTAGKPVAGTCGKSCGHQGCADIGSKPVPAGKLLGDGSHGDELEYEMFTTPDGRLQLHDMNTETIDYGTHPKAATNFKTAPVAPCGSSIYHVPQVAPSGELLLLERFSMEGQLLKVRKQGGWGAAKTVLDGAALTGWYNNTDLIPAEEPTEAKLVPLQWRFTGKDAKSVMALIGVAPKSGGEFLDTVLVDYTL